MDKYYKPDMKLFNELVPPIGPSETLEGEILRAVHKITYRWYNDGDYSDAEDAKYPYAFLDAIGFNKFPNTIYDKQEYSMYVDDLVKRAEEYVKSKNNNYTSFNGDMFELTTWNNIKIKLN